MQVPYAQALAISSEQGCISRVGSNSEVRALQEAGSQVHDLHGHWIMPVSIGTMSGVGAVITA